MMGVHRAVHFFGNRAARTDAAPLAIMSSSSST
jgi:hypothetical protein